MLNTLRKLFSCGLIAANFFCTAAYAAPEFITDKYEPVDVTVEIEAEDFDGAGFSIVSDPEASGGKCIVGTGKGTGVMQYKLSLDKNASKFVIYAIHKSDNIRQSLSYLSVDSFENCELYDYEYGVWNSTRLFFHKLDAGEYTINLKSVRSGQKIDKLIIKYNIEETATAEEKIADTDLTGYKQGDDSRADLKITEISQRVPGSYFAEVESGTFEKEAGSVVANDDASGDKVWISTAAKKLMDPQMLDEPELRFKFYISKTGQYNLHLRYRTPETESKGIWIAVDDEDYYRQEDGQKSDKFKWKKVQTYKLAEGWHTLDIKHRTAGQLLDCIILTDDLSFSPMGYGSLPGDDLNLDEVTLAYVAERHRRPKVKSNNYRLRSDGEFKITDNDIILPATNLAQALQMNMEENPDGSYFIGRDRNYLKFYADSNRVIANGKVILTKEKQFIYGDDIPSISLSAAKKAFGFDYEYDEDENTLHIFDFYKEPYIRPAEDGEINISVGKKFLYYDIPYDNPDAGIEVWLRARISDIEGLQKMNYDNLNTIANGGYDYKFPSYQYTNGANAWVKAQTPVYVDGAFRGAQYSSIDTKYDVKVRIVDNGKENVFMATAPDYTGGYDTAKTPRDYTYDTNGGIVLVPTFENISFYVDCDRENAECKVYYKKSDESDWHKAYEPTWDFVSKQFRGTITFLEQNTEYDVKAVVTVNGSEVLNTASKIRTWQDNPPVKETVRLKDIYSGKGDLVLSRIQGTDDGWIKIDGEGAEINAGKLTEAAVVITECKNLIFENVVVKGGSGMGITVDERSENIRIVNCDISEWGLGSIQDPEFGLYIRSGKTYNTRAGVAAMDSVNLVVERCYIHDSDANTNPWLALNGSYNNVHPAGSCAVLMYGLRGTVIRYNDFVGSDEHRFNDVLEGADNGGRNTGSCGSDSDIYGNMLIFSNDDIMELDGAQMNVRVYHNRMEEAHCGVSTAPNTMGPSYIFRNLITYLGSENSEFTRYYGSAMKSGGMHDEFPITYFFNNTFVWRNCIQNANFGGSYVLHAITRNNIFETTIAGGISLKNVYANERDSYDYDLYNGEINLSIDGQEKNGIKGTAEFSDIENADYRLTDASTGVGSGASLDNFAEGSSINMGAFANDGNDELFLPARPVDMYADTYRVTMKDGEEKKITVHFGDIGEGRTYSLKKNRDFDWIEFVGDETENVPAKPNSDVSFTIKTNLSASYRRFGYGKGAVLLRLDNGYSIPITVRCEGEEK